MQPPNRENQKSKNAVDGAYGTGAEALDERASEAQAEINGEAERDDSDHHSQIRKKTVGVGSQAHDYAD